MFFSDMPAVGVPGKYRAQYAQRFLKSNSRARRARTFAA
jgi:hypothetical protein